MVAVNDKTRPVPHKFLLSPLLARLEAMDISRDAITIIVAVGAHPPMPAAEFDAILPEEVLQRYRVVSHDPDDRESLVYLGQTQRGTPMWINRRFAQADLRIVVGNIEPHQFQGFSGGYKTAAIGLAGRETVNHNHALMTDPKAVPCHFYQGQKALAHASLVTKDGGTVILVAACPEGTGSASYQRWMEGVTSCEAVFEKFKREGFSVGPHKAYQIARDASRVRALMLSEMPPGARVGVMPAANSTIPVMRET